MKEWCGELRGYNDLQELMGKDWRNAAEHQAHKAAQA